MNKSVKTRATKFINYIKNNQESCRKIEDIFENGDGDLVVHEIMKRGMKDENLEKLLKNHKLVGYNVWLEIHEKIEKQLIK